MTVLFVMRLWEIIDLCLKEKYFIIDFLNSNKLLEKSLDLVARCHHDNNY